MACCFSVCLWPQLASYLTGFEEQLPFIHHDLVRVCQGGPKGEDVFVLEDFQRPPLPTLVDRDGICADAQPEVLGKAAFLALVGESQCAGQIRKQLKPRTQKTQASQHTLCTGHRTHPVHIHAGGLNSETWHLFGCPIIGESQHLALTQDIATLWVMYVNKPCEAATAEEPDRDPSKPST